MEISDRVDLIKPLANFLSCIRVEQTLQSGTAIGKFFKIKGFLAIFARQAAKCANGHHQIGFITQT